MPDTDYPPASSSPSPSAISLNCPLPLSRHKEIQLGHGGGGRLTQQLIDELFLPAFSNEALAAAHDGAVFAPGTARLAFATDSHVVSPLEFPGGDIGSLSVHGTANDLAMCGARPRWMSVGFILEEGLPMATLARVVASMQQAAQAIGLRIVTGDTKVVERGKGDGVYINTSGIGEVLVDDFVGPAAVCPGDAILLSGDIGRHGMAIMAQREGLEFESSLESDSAHLWPCVEALIAAGVQLHCLRDLTRGGLAAALLEIAAASRHDILLEERAIPVDEAVNGACELLGLDALNVANEGRFIAFLPESQVATALRILRESAPGGGRAARIGTVEQGSAGEVRMRSLIGIDRILDRPSGEQLPRIC